MLSYAGEMITLAAASTGAEVGLLQFSITFPDPLSSPQAKLMLNGVVREVTIPESFKTLLSVLLPPVNIWARRGTAVTCLDPSYYSDLHSTRANVEILLTAGMPVPSLYSGMNRG